jgi:hypothetical protein
VARALAGLRFLGKAHPVATLATIKAVRVAAVRVESVRARQNLTLPETAGRESNLRFLDRLCITQAAAAGPLSLLALAAAAGAGTERRTTTPGLLEAQTPAAAAAAAPLRRREALEDQV